MRPQTYVGTEFFDYQNVGLFAHERINSTSFRLGEYEALKNSAVDPYVSMRDIYIQYRTDLIENR
jgi:phospholipid-binding lipoprotein MlaA